MKTSIIAISNQKGGVGKTATSVNLAACFAALKRKTLLIDVDYQGNATSNLGLMNKAKSESKTLSMALKNKIPPEHVIIKSYDEYLDVIAGDMGLSKLSREKILEPGAPMILKHWLDNEVIKNYEIVIIDTHPSLDLLFQMVMTAAHYYLVPMFAEADPFDGLQYMLEEVASIKEYLNPQLFFLGIVITKYDKQNATHKKFYNYLKQHMDENKVNVFNSIIPDSTAIASSSSSQRPLLQHNAKLQVTQSYVELANELLPELRGIRQGRKQSTPQIERTPEEIKKLFESDIKSTNYRSEVEL